MSTFQKFEAKVQAAPLQSVVIGMVCAWMLVRLPVFGLLGAIVRVALAVGRPALLILGGAKAWELIQARTGRVDLS